MKSPTEAHAWSLRAAAGVILAAGPLRGDALRGVVTHLSEECPFRLWVSQTDPLPHASNVLTAVGRNDTVILSHAPLFAVADEACHALS